MKQPHSSSSHPIDEIPSHHWADQAAQDLMTQKPHQELFVCASGISPSGMVHIGNFREAITVDFVVRALKTRGKKTRFIYSWDDFDAFRKVPVNLPEQDLLKKNLRKPLSFVPDPYGKEESYAASFEKAFEKSLEQVEISPEYIRQHQPYLRGDYADGILHALKNQRAIKAILDTYRTEPLPEDWTLLSIFCKECLKDQTKLISWNEEGDISYHCHSCKVDRTTSVKSNNSFVKLLWRVDWPMRWAKEKVDFEPGGKDHSSEGGSYDTGCRIVREVWKTEPPHYVQYDFVIAKGGGAKLSSSSGNLITLEEALSIYEPSVLRWIFASRKPNVDFSIAFDLDVLKAYDDFDRTMRIALKQETAEEKKYTYERRIYELSVISTYPLEDSSCVQFSFRHLCNQLQVYQGNLEETFSYYQKYYHKLGHQLDETAYARFKARAQCAWHWITQFAPAEFQFKLREAGAPRPALQYPTAIDELITLLSKVPFDSIQEDELATQIYGVIKGNGLEAKKFFQDVYQCLIQKNQGPKLASFLLTLGKEKSISLLK